MTFPQHNSLKKGEKTFLTSSSEMCHLLPTYPSSLEILTSRPKSDVAKCAVNLTGSALSNPAKDEVKLNRGNDKHGLDAIRILVK